MVVESRLCNQGMKFVWMSKVTPTGYSPVPEGLFDFTSSPCISGPESIKTRVMVFGCSSPFSGVIGQNGPATLAGLKAAFAERNRLGGLSGFQLRISSLDDGYVRDRAINNTQSFIRGRVYGLIGYLGTEIANVIAPMANASGLPLIAPLTGAASLRTNNPNVVNLRASYADEINALTRELLKGVLAEGRRGSGWVSWPGVWVGLQFLSAALEAVNLHLLSSGSYSSNTLDVDDGLNAILSGALPFVPEAIVVFSTGAQAAKFIQHARTRLPNSTVFLCSSIVGEGFLSAFSANNTFDNIYVSQVFPLITDLSYSLVRDYHAAMQAVNSSYKASMISMEAYVAGRLTIEVLDRVKSGQQDRASFLTSLYGNSFFMLSGVVVGPFTPACSQGLRKVWLSKVVNGQYVPLPSDTFSFGSEECISNPSFLRNRFLVFGQSAPFSGNLLSFSGPQLRAGILAAFYEENQLGGIYGHLLRLVSLDDGFTATRAVANTVALLGQKVNALIGFLGTGVGAAVAPIAANASVPFISPYTGSAALRNPVYNITYVRASYLDEINAMTHFVTLAFGYMQISIFYQADAFGNEGIAGLSKALAAIGTRILSVGNYSIETGDVMQGLNDIQKNGASPNVIFVWAIGHIAARFVAAAKTRFPPDTVYICPSSAVDLTFLNTTGGAPLENLYVAQVLPPFQNSAHPLAKHYLQALQAYNSSMVPTMYSFEGYVNAKVMVTNLRRMSGFSIRNPRQFLDTLFANPIFSLDSTTIGPYIKGQCLSGLRQVWISQFDRNSFVDLPDYTFDFTPSCVSDAAETLHRPIVFGFVSADDSASAYDIRMGMEAVFAEMNSLGGVSGQALHIAVLTLDALTTEHEIKDFITRNQISALITNGKPSPQLSVVATIAESLNVFLIASSRFTASRSEKALNPNVISVGGSPLDEAFAVARYARKSLGLTSLTAICDNSVSGDESAKAIRAVVGELSMSLNGLHRYESYTDVSRISGVLVSDLSVQAIVVSGSQPLLLDLISALRVVQKPLPIFIIASDFNVSALQDRYSTAWLFLTHFGPPICSATDEFSVSCKQAALKLNQYSPSLWTGDGCLIGGLVAEVVRYSQRFLSSTSFSSEALYDSELFTINGIRLGPYANSTCKSRRSNANCECDQGMHTVWLLKLTSNRTSPVDVVSDGTLSFDTCGVVLSSTDSTSALTAIIIGAVCGCAFLTLIVGAFVLYVSMSKKRQRVMALRVAPKGNVTIVFTDVQDSTKLWELCPIGMKEALDIHNALLRELIEKHRGYEVKTQGDSFMVAFWDAQSALEWSLEVQEALLLAPWPEELLMQESCAVEMNPETSGKTGHDCLFRGLRVRIGIHCGRPEVEYNKRTNGVDYFGPIVNGAARIEALGAGGQVLISAEAHAHLRFEQNSNVDFMFLGRFPLKGMVTEQEIFQASTTRLAFRQFPVIDAKRVMTANDKGVPTCDECSRPLICTRCQMKRLNSFRRQSAANQSEASRPEDTRHSGSSRGRHPVTSHSPDVRPMASPEARYAI